MKTHCVIQITLLNALWRPKWEGNPRQNTYIHTYVYIYIYMWLIHFTVQKNLTQQCKANILQH